MKKVGSILVKACSSVPVCASLRLSFPKRAADQCLCFRYIP